MYTLAEIRAGQEAYEREQEKLARQEDALELEAEEFEREIQELRGLNPVQKRATKEDLIHRYSESTNPLIHAWVTIFLFDVGQSELFWRRARELIEKKAPMPARFGEKTWLEFVGFGLAQLAEESRGEKAFNDFFASLSDEQIDQSPGGLAKVLLKRKFLLFYQQKNWEQAVRVGEWALRHGATIITKLEEARKQITNTREYPAPLPPPPPSID